MKNTEIFSNNEFLLSVLSDVEMFIALGYSKYCKLRLTYDFLDRTT